MPQKDYKSLVGGGALILVGVVAVILSYNTLRMGTFARMGPGMFPIAAGAMLAAIGATICLPALLRSGDPIKFDLRSFVTISLSLSLFSIVIANFGLISALVVGTFVCSRADAKLPLSSMVSIILGLSLGAYLIFRLGLNLSMPFLKWPW